MAASVIILAALILSGCGSSSSGSDKSWETVKKKGEFVLGLDDNFPPMGFRDENNEITGFDIDVAKEVFSRLDLELKLQPIDWNSKEQELNTGNIDCIWNGFTITEERKEQVLFTKPYMKNRQVLVVLADSEYTEPSDLEGKKLGLQAASSAADGLEKAAEFKEKLGEILEFDNNVTVLMDLEKGGIDVALMDEPVARYYIQMKDKGYRIIGKELANEEFGIGFRKNDVKLMEKVQETLEEMAKDGKLAEISNKWFGEDITTISK